MRNRLVACHLHSIRLGPQVFRESDVGNFLLSTACRYHGERFMRHVLGPVLQPMAKVPAAFEISAKKVADEFFLDANRLNLRKAIGLLLQRLCTSCCIIFFFAVLSRLVLLTDELQASFEQARELAEAGSVERAAAAEGDG